MSSTAPAAALMWLPVKNSLLLNKYIVNIYNMITETKANFLKVCRDCISNQLMLAYYAKDELDPSKSETEGFVRMVPEESADEINSRELPGFYIWCYINYMIDGGVRRKTLNGLAFPVIHICLNYR